VRNQISRSEAGNLIRDQYGEAAEIKQISHCVRNDRCLVIVYGVKLGLIKSIEIWIKNADATIQDADALNSRHSRAGGNPVMNIYSLAGFPPTPE
jgi:hypothetical protein